MSKKKDKKWKISKKFAEKLLKSNKKDKQKKKKFKTFKEFAQSFSHVPCDEIETNVQYTYDPTNKAVIDGGLIEDLTSILDELVCGRISSNELDFSCNIININSKRIKFGCSFYNKSNDRMFAHCYLSMHTKEDDPVMYSVRCGEEFIKLMNGKSDYNETDLLFNVIGNKYTIKFYD